ncbi:putative odorant-binding protein A5 [Scaptodrosophila lebanonensis]|uniref:Odorant-binding protein A5 n=1 Tax=Drosophila lebanonensis TaxID=7225 RepID=A0A6J2U5E6_DROLE|nr:putative odorant-binding protein A5 [Scaptodrosophila lebanonensis]
MQYLIAVSSFVLALALAQGEERDVQRIMKDMSIIPDVLKEPPKELLKVIFENRLNIEEGNLYTPMSLKFEPKLDWDADEDTYYTIVMLTPDAPSRENPIYRSWLHWLVVNVPGDSISKGQIISEYYGPIPPKKSGELRYVVLVYEQSDKIEFKEQKVELNNPDQHSNFDVQKFADKYSLGTPVAGNTFLAKWDESVPELMQLLYGISDVNE